MALKTGVKAQRAYWTSADEVSLLDFLAEHQSEAGDGGNFKGATWTSAAAHVNETKTRGAPKTKDSCRSKYGSVCEFLHSFSIHS